MPEVNQGSKSKTQLEIPGLNGVQEQSPNQEQQVGAGEQWGYPGKQRSPGQHGESESRFREAWVRRGYLGRADPLEGAGMGETLLF